MAFGVVLDACVLYPFSLSDILLRLADREFFEPYKAWLKRSGTVRSGASRFLANQARRIAGWVTVVGRLSSRAYGHRSRFLDL